MLIFLSLNFANVPMQVGLSPDWVYSGPTYVVDKVVIGTASQDAILPMNAPALKLLLEIRISWTFFDLR